MGQLLELGERLGVSLGGPGGERGDRPSEPLGLLDVQPYLARELPVAGVVVAPLPAAVLDPSDVGERVRARAVA